MANVAKAAPKKEIANIKEASTKRRIWEVDALRGFLILFVVFDHLMFDIGSLFGGDFTSAFMQNFSSWAQDYLSGGLRSATHYWFVAGFVLLSGISTRFSKNNFMKAAKVLLFAFLLTWLTAIGETTQMFSNALIVFGILHMLGFAGLIYAALEKFKTPWWALAALGAVFLASGFYFLANPVAIAPGDSAFKSVCAIFVGTRGASFYSADYFPLLPWAGFFLVGAAGGRLLYREKLSLLPRFNEKYVSPLTFCGRNSLWIYLLAQAVPIALIYTFVGLGVM